MEISVDENVRNSNLTTNGTAHLKNCLSTNIYSYLETSGSNLYLNVVNFFFNTSVYYTSVASENSCSPALVYNMSCSIERLGGLVR